jgi:hypothetical protein
MIDTLVLSLGLGFTVAPIRRWVASQAIIVTEGLAAITWPLSSPPAIASEGRIDLLMARS